MALTNNVKTLVAKKKARASKKKTMARNKVAALPAVPKVILDENYINPITLEFPKGIVIYEIKNRKTGRKNYYDKITFRKLITAFKNDYNILMANPKEPIKNAKNPITRGPIYSRNIRRVTVKPKSKNNAARKIQTAVRAHLKKKKSNKK